MHAHNSRKSSQGLYLRLPEWYTSCVRAACNRLRATGCACHTGCVPQACVPQPACGVCMTASYSTGYTLGSCHCMQWQLEFPPSAESQHSTLAYCCWAAELVFHACGSSDGMPIMICGGKWIFYSLQIDI